MYRAQDAKDMVDGLELVLWQYLLKRYCDSIVWGLPIFLIMIQPPLPSLHVCAFVLVSQLLELLDPGL